MLCESEDCLRLFCIHLFEGVGRQRRKSTNAITYQEAFQMLRRVGFTEPTIARLYQLRQGYMTNVLDCPSLDLNRLRFVLWLVATGRLTDSLPEIGVPEAARHHLKRSGPARKISEPRPFLFQRRANHPWPDGWRKSRASRSISSS